MRVPWACGRSEALLDRSILRGSKEGTEKRRTTRCICKSAERTSSTNTRPALVSVTVAIRRLLYVNRGNLASLSISLICLRSADWLMFYLCAARLKFSSSAKTGQDNDCVQLADFDIVKHGSRLRSTNVVVSLPY